MTSNYDIRECFDKYQIPTELLVCELEQDWYYRLLPYPNRLIEVDWTIILGSSSKEQSTKFCMETFYIQQKRNELDIKEMSGA